MSLIVINNRSPKGTLESLCPTLPSPHLAPRRRGVPPARPFQGKPSFVGDGYAFAPPPSFPPSSLSLFSRHTEYNEVRRRYCYSRLVHNIFFFRFFNRTRGDHSVAFHHQQQQSDRQTRAPLPYPALASLPAGGPYPSHEHKIRWTWYQVPGIYYSMCFFFERCHLLHYYTKYSGVSIIMRCGSNPL